MYTLGLSVSGSPRGGAGRRMTPKPMGFRRPNKGPMGLIEPIEMTLTNQFVEDRRPFFLRSHKNSEKIEPFHLEDLFFFGDHMKIRRKLCQFRRLFWTAQNQSCAIFELTPGPSLVLGAPGPSNWLYLLLLTGNTHLLKLSRKSSLYS